MSFFFFFFVNMVVFTQYQPLLKEWTWCVSGRGSLWAGFFFFFKGWLDFTVLLTHSGGMFWTKGYSHNKFHMYEVFLGAGVPLGWPACWLNGLLLCSLNSQ